MSTEQLSMKCDSSNSLKLMSKQQSAASDPETPMVVSDKDDDFGDDETFESVGMQFATETIVKKFSRCTSADGTIDRMFVETTLLVLRMRKKISVCLVLQNAD